MEKYIRALLVIAIIALALNVSAQTTGSSHQIEIYFQERIKNGHSESQLIPFEHGGKLSKRNWKKHKEQVWELWKKVNNAQEQLPSISDAADDLSTNQWTLIGEDPLPFYFFKKGTLSHQKMPLFLNLHGSGPKAIEFKNTVAWAKRYQDSPSIYFIPQIPSERRYRWWLQPVQYAWERLFRLAMLHEQIDPNQLFITGISEGGYGSQRLGAYYADYLAGVGPMAGGEPLRNAPPINFRYIAFSLQTGENDHMFGRNTLTKAAKDTFEILAEKHPNDYNHQIIIQPGKGHGIDYTTTTPWLKQFYRNVNPKDLAFVLFPMDGRYRKSFYNIALNSALKIKEGDPKDRILFFVKMFDNEIKIESYLSDPELKEKERYDVDFSVFLDDRYVDLKKRVSVIYNGRKVFNKRMQLSEAALVESTALFADPERIFPAKIEISSNPK